MYGKLRGYRLKDNYVQAQLWQNLSKGGYSYLERSHGSSRVLTISRIRSPTPSCLALPDFLRFLISCIILLSFRSHKYVIPFSEGTFDEVFPIWRHPGPSLQVTEVAAAKADEDLQAWLPWFSAESRIYMNLRKSLGVNKRILKYLWYSKKHSDVTDVLVKSCLVDIELLV